MRTIVIGSGAMGSIFGAALAEGGAEVVLLDVDAAHVGAIQADGLILEGMGGGAPRRLLATTRVEEAGKADLAVVLVDTAASAAANAAAAAGS